MVTRIGSAYAPDAGLAFVAGLDDLLAGIVAAGADVVPPMHFAADRFDRERRVGEKVVRAMHPALGSRFPVLLHSHVDYSSSILWTASFRVPRHERERKQDF